MSIGAVERIERSSGKLAVLPGFLGLDRLEIKDILGKTTDSAQSISLFLHVNILAVHFTKFFGTTVCE